MHALSAAPQIGNAFTTGYDKLVVQALLVLLNLSYRHSQIGHAFTIRCHRLVMKALYYVADRRNAFTTSLDKLVLPADLTVAN
jgi:hypothetical protein